jgi:parallel beta-helix repeat protein
MLAALLSSVLSSCTVTTTADSAPGSLRDCITQVNASSVPSTIDFDPAVFSPGTITLLSPLPTLSSGASVFVDGVDATHVLIDGNNAVGIGLSITSPNVTIHAVTFQNFGGDAIDIGGNAVHAGIDHVHIADAGSNGIQVSFIDGGVTITNSTIERCALFAVFIDGTGNCADHTIFSGNISQNNDPNDGVYITQSSCIDVTDNTFNNNTLCGVRLALGSSQCNVQNNVGTGNGSGVCMFGGAHDNQITENQIFNSVTEGIVVGDPMSTGNLIAHNIVVSSLLSGSSPRGWGIHLYPNADGTHVYSNTLYANAGPGIVVENFGSTTVLNFAVVDNIVALSGGPPIVSVLEPTAVFGPNLFFENDGGELPDSGFDADPLFKDPANDDFHLSCGSLAIDTGVNVGLTFNGTAPDMGALETGGNDCGGGMGAGGGGAATGGGSAATGGGASQGGGAAAGGGTATGGGGPGGGAQAGGSGAAGGGRQGMGSDTVSCACDAAPMAFALTALLVWPRRRRR